ncbi:hypothetical protein EXU85_20380 [Spirosoma sp. KCTC 42546]|uniref:major capsid protein n=1 Tax=Spirosoma sp. KCTC 42546 TaxID=2520506 RepID=UPI001157E2F7|nr:major capsid protein [Spirosoma sp. KCTC 42546]QDK80837.1 hypothetical protein EXU85_20380 [Spirosoma sp. KCTC 42546]
METSLFLQWVAKYLPGITIRIVETLNGTNNPLTYLHRSMLREDLSVTGKWEAINTANTAIMADVVAMDSSLPLKKRDSISKANGDIPKLGMKLQLNERQLTDLDTLVATGASDQQIVAKLFADTPKVITGVYERCEEMFLRGLSTGVTLIEDTENVGTGIRIDYGYASANKFGVAVLWSSASTATPFDDIQRILDKASADGNTITVCMLDRSAFNNLVNTTQAKQLFAFSQSFVGSAIPAPSLSQMNSFVSDRYGFTFQIVERSVRYEKNGTQTAVKPWATGAAVFLTSTQVGTLVYAKLAEEGHPVTNVTYQKAGNFILVSKYRKNDPLAEFTSSQARVVPVISNVDQIYLLDSTTVQS